MIKENEQKLVIRLIRNEKAIKQRRIDKIMMIMLILVYNKQMFDCCKNTSTIFFSAFEEEALLEGITDVMVIRQKSGHYSSTQFFACFGSMSILQKDTPIKLLVNRTLISNITLTLDKYGYCHPTKLTSEQLKSLNLKMGKNQLEYTLGDLNLRAEIYLYTDMDKLVISDVDGTLTKNDLGGLYNNYRGNGYLHDGYHELIHGINDNGYKVAWMTMRSLPLYTFSKQYIKTFVGVEGPVLMQPEEFFQAIKKQVLKKTDNIKANIMQNIKETFPQHVNPFIGGLGNRENDAIAYLHAGIPLHQIYIIDTDSDVHRLDNPDHKLTYPELLKDIEEHFPKYHSPKIGYK